MGIIWVVYIVYYIFIYLTILIWIDIIKFLFFKKMNKHLLIYLEIIMKINIMIKFLNYLMMNIIFAKIVKEL